MYELVIIDEGFHIAYYIIYLLLVHLLYLVVF